MNEPVTIITSRTVKEQYTRFLYNQRRFDDDMARVVRALRRPRPWRRWWWGQVRLLWRPEKWWHVPHWKHRLGRASYDASRAAVRADLGYGTVEGRDDAGS